ncbi:MAG: hypothetical protein ACT4OU_04500 [Hyphomicrobium sp.]
MSRTLKTVALAAATVFAAFGGVGAAEAGGKHLRFHSFHGHHYLDYGPRYRIVIGGRGCGYLYRRWLRTGDPYWKSEYYDCRGWY